MTIEELNTAAPEIVREKLTQCCGSHAWVEQMVRLRPFADRNALLSAAGAVWNSLQPEDWLEAFSHHPKIGAKSASKWSSDEQRGMQTASSETASTMHQLNLHYERKFGWIFIICANGKSANEMLASIQSRIRNDSATELSIAAREQSKITQLRLEKLLDE